MPAKNTTPADRARKKPKRPRPGRDDQPSPPTAQVASTRASLTNLPIEILAEILLYTCFPPTVLAVSRTCSFLHHTLVQNPSVSFIWRGVRKTCRPAPLPEPGSFWGGSEAAYAAFVFGEGVCEVCRKPTRAMYTSFAARIRLCGSWHCRRKMLSESLVDVTSKFPRQRDRQLICMPYVESRLCFFPSANHASTWPNNDIVLFRKTDFEKFQLELAAYRDAEEARARALASGATELATLDETGAEECIMQRCHARVKSFPEIMGLSAHLADWKDLYNREYKINQRRNRKWTKDLAEREGWDLNDLVASQVYGSLQRRKNSLLEEIGLSDLSPVRSALESELLAIQTRHKRQKAEATYEEKLSEIKKIYERMRCGTLDGVHTSAASPSDPSDGLVLPPFRVFSMLPSVRALKGSPDPNAVPPNSTTAAADIKSSSLVTTLVISDLHSWFVPVQKRLVGLLGYPEGWQSASSRTLHPLRRVTARFFCQRCGKGEVGRRYQREKCLDIKGVCSHVCVQRKRVEGRRQEAPQESETEVTEVCNGDGKGKGKGRKGVKTLDWKVDVFAKDETAIRLITTLLDLADLSEEDPSAASSLSAKGGVIRCTTCPGWVVMDFETAIGHAHRHEAMQIRLLDASTPPQVTYTKEDGNASYPRLGFERGMVGLLLGPARRAHGLCKRVNYGCRHCLLVTEQDAAVVEVGKGARAMSFNGLRSHVKEKHGIQDIQDEDFFCYSPIGTTT